MPDQIEEALRQTQALPPDELTMFVLRILEGMGAPPSFLSVLSSIVKTPGVCGVRLD